MRTPATRKEAYRQIKQRQKEERRRARVGMAAGDERYLPARDRGPVRKLARDYVDSRRTVNEYFLYIALLVIALSIVPVLAVQALAYYVVFPALLIAVVVESVMLTRKTKRLAAQRFPDESIKGVGYYAITRSMQIRRLRLPPPKVKPGEEI